MKWFCNHDWTAWSELVSTYEAPYQFRSCTKCNKIKSRRFSYTSNSVNLLVWNSKPLAINKNKE